MGSTTPILQSSIYILEVITWLKLSFSKNLTLLHVFLILKVAMNYESKLELLLSLLYVTFSITWMLINSFFFLRFINFANVYVKGVHSRLFIFNTVRYFPSFKDRNSTFPLFCMCVWGISILFLSSFYWVTTICTAIAQVISWNDKCNEKRILGWDKNVF